MAACLFPAFSRVKCQVSLGGKHAGSERQLQCQCWNSFKCFLTLNELGLDVTKVGGIASDGASVMLGCNNGEAAKLKAIVPSVMVVHCICHQLALACADSNQELSYIESQNLSDWTVEAFWVFKPEDGSVYEDTVKPMQPSALAKCKKTAKKI